MRKILSLVIVCNLFGCSLVKVPDQERYSTDEKLKIDECISNYHSTGCEESLGELYAIKSSLYAHRNLTYYGTRVFGGVGTELLFQTSAADHWPTGITFLILTPFTFIGETIYYPIQVYEHVNVPDENLENALFYLQKARENGYADEYMRFLPSYIRVKNLDK